MDLTVQELVKNYAAVRKRLMGIPPIQLKTPVVVIVEEPPKPKPDLWQSMADQWESEMKGSYDPDGKKIPEIKQIVRLVCRAEKVNLTDFYSKRRNKELVFPRHIVCWIARKVTLKSLPTIARAIGRDHTTVLSSVRKIDRLLVSNNALRDKLDTYSRQIEGVG